MQATDLDLSLVTEEDISQEIQCESLPHEYMPGHRADWYWQMTCGYILAVCESRHAEAIADGAMCIPFRCAFGCNQMHDVAETTFIPIDPSA